jgi:hypothetical protein
MTRKAISANFQEEIKPMFREAEKFTAEDDAQRKKLLIPFLPSYIVSRNTQASMKSNTYSSHLLKFEQTPIPNGNCNHFTKVSCGCA